MPIRAAIYLRISQDQTGEALGVSRQLEDCENVAKAQGWDVVEVYTDNDVSATSSKPRPEYRRLLNAIKAGQIDAVVTWHADRLYRKMTDLIELLEIVQANNTLIATARAGNIDLTTDSGQMVAEILASVAGYEGRAKATRWKRSVRQRREQGRPPGSGVRLYGYLPDGTIVPDEAQVARWMAREILDGTSINRLAVKCADRGLTTTRGNPWSNQGLRKYLLNPRLAGHSVLRGDIIAPGQWKPILDAETWENVRAILSANVAPTKRVRVGLLTGLLRCGQCGHRLETGARFTGKGKPTQRVYRCRSTSSGESCGGVSGVADIINEVVESYARTRLADPRVRAEIQNLKNAPREQVAEITAMEMRIQELEKQLDEPGVPVDTILRAIDRARERLETLVRSLAGFPTMRLPAADTWPDDLHQRRALIALVVDSVTLAPRTGKPGPFDVTRVQIAAR